MSETVSIVIPTYKREKDLQECIASIAQQTVRPLEVIVVDDAELPAVPGAHLLEAAGIECVYRRKNGNRGTSASRNLGCSLARGRFLLYLDDDVELEPTYIERMLEIFNNDSEGLIAGASGFNTLDKKNPSLIMQVKAWISLLFMIDGPWPGRVLPSGFCTLLRVAKWSENHLIDCDVLPSCDMMLRKDLVADVVWQTDYEGYGLGEDHDFSYQISRKYRLVLTGAAQFIHKESPVAKPDPRLRGRKTVFHQYRFYIDHVRRSAWQDPVFVYALFNLIAQKILVALFVPSRKNWQRVLGLLEGSKLIRRGRG